MKKTLVLLLALVALALPAAAHAAPNEGPGTVTIAPDPLVVPTTTVGSPGEWLSVDLSYDGEGGAAIDEISLLGEEAAEFSFSGSDCNTLQSGDHCTAWFALKPTTAGEKQATLEIRFQGERPAETRPISGSAVEPSLSFDPASLDFGRIWTGRGGYLYVQVQNTGAAPIQLESFGFQGADPGNFWLGENGCMGSSGATMNPGAACSVQINFQPWDVRPYEATFVARASGAEFSVALSGEGGFAELVPETNPVDLGSAAVGSRGEVRTITLTNHGNLPGAFFIALVAGGDVGSFELLAEDCSMRGIEPGQSCDLQVRFRPTSPGTKSARLAMFGESDGGAMVFLQGEGVPAAIQLSTPNLELGGQQVGTRGSARTVWVRNEGTVPATVDQVRLAGLDPDQFVLAGDECGDEGLAPGAACALRVRFAPDSPGPKAASLRVSGDFGVLSAALTGTGLLAPAGSTAATAAAATPDSAAKPHPRSFARNKTIRAPKRAKASGSKAKRQSKSSTRSGVRGSS